MLTGNKGEWSEIYTFFKLLAEGKLYGADGDLNKKDDVFYKILKIIRNEQVGTLHFVFDSTNEVVHIKNDNNDIKVSIETETFKKQTEILYDKIVSTKGSAAFSILETSKFMEEILCSKLKAPSNNKSDITIKVHDFNTGLEPTLGFSIKSRLGKPSTLLNAGANTNFIFEICGDMDDAKMDYINSLFVEKKKDGVVIKKDIAVGARVEYIAKNGLTLSFYKMNGKTFQNNLILIDSALPHIVGYAMLEYYLNGTNNILQAIKVVARKNPLGYDLEQGHKYYQYKMMKLLAESALGMLPGKVWTGRADANGGYIIVREDGEVLCYHLYNRNDFEEYLLNNTRFDRGGADKHKYGVVEKIGEKYYISLNLQIRFIR